ncbi:hypothetical protein [Moheibacter lacus]|uniref:Uncharacterized protein n=1 Tax=Moheibacter lacus TaxID=2745851 RepID=A0A838ZQL7_9FLAO|nr:hypothetical protein [Moheibacter lacus]MBA5628262.1 hypothetical protein [Moheibacter lacus]
MKNCLAYGLIIFSGLCPEIYGYAQFYEETEEVPQGIYQNYELYHDLNNRFYEQSQEFEYFKSEPVQEVPTENYADDGPQDPPNDDDPPVPIGKLWIVMVFLSGLGLGVFYQSKRAKEMI